MTPGRSRFTVVEGFPTETKVPVPLKTLQEPVPTVGRSAERVALVPQTLWLVPATELLGNWSLQMLVVAELTGHTPFEIDQVKVFSPG